MKLHHKILTRKEFEYQFDFDPVLDAPHLRISVDAEYQINMENLTVSVVTGNCIHGSFEITNLEEVHQEDALVHLEAEGITVEEILRGCISENAQLKEELKISWSIMDNELCYYIPIDGFGFNTIKN